MERTSVKTLKNILNFDDYSRSMFYVGFFMKNEIAKISYEAAHLKALLWFLKMFTNILESMFSGKHGFCQNGKSWEIMI